MEYLNVSLDYARQSATTNGTGFSDNQQRRNYKMKKQNMIDEIRKRIDAPFKEFMSVSKRFDEQPSIPNGARRQSAALALYKALNEMAEYALENWNLSPEEFNKIVESLKI